MDSFLKFSILEIQSLELLKIKNAKSQMVYTN